MAYEDEDFSNSQSKYFNSTLLRNEHEFYKEEENVEHKLISVRKAKLKKVEDWEILEGKKVVFVLKGVRFSNSEKNFFKTVDGIRFILDGYKQGWNSVSKFKNEVKKVLK